MVKKINFYHILIVAVFILALYNFQNFWIIARFIYLHCHNFLPKIILSLLLDLYLWLSIMLLFFTPVLLLVMLWYMVLNEIATNFKNLIQSRFPNLTTKKLILLIAGFYCLILLTLILAVCFIKDPIVSKTCNNILRAYGTVGLIFFVAAVIIYERYRKTKIDLHAILKDIEEKKKQNPQATIVVEIRNRPTDVDVVKEIERTIEAKGAKVKWI